MARWSQPTFVTYTFLHQAEFAAVPHRIGFQEPHKALTVSRSLFNTQRGAQSKRYMRIDGSD
jgi:hypothetical protein